MKPTVLFVNHTQIHCGVYQMGRRIGSELAIISDRDLERARYRFQYMEADGPDAVEAQIRQLGAEAVIYNWHPSTMPWVGDVIGRCPSIKPIGLIHEISAGAANEGQHLFPWRMVCDPTFPADSVQLFKSVRHVPRFDPPPVNNGRMTVGSFGFSVGGKQYSGIVEAVAQEFPGALLRLHLPAAHYGDPDGSGASAIASRCVEIGDSYGLGVQISREFMTECRLLHWLAHNDLNVFFYEPNAGRGCASVLDYAIAAQRPIAVNDSLMFRHVHDVLASYPHRSLRWAHEQNDEAIKHLYESWSPDRLRNEYDLMLDVIFNLHHEHRGPAPKTLPSRFNRLLDDEAREEFRSPIERMRQLCPELMARKIERAHVQQAFVLWAVMELASVGAQTRVLSVGAYEDTAFTALRELEYNVEGIDPRWGHDLAAWHTRLLGRPTYDVIFATSVIEHVEDDATFVRQMTDLLKPGGYAVLTMDFHRCWRPEMPKPGEDCRLYTIRDMARLLAAMVDCELLDAPSWATHGAHDFTYDGCHYAFATLVVGKRLGEMSEWTANAD